MIHLNYQNWTAKEIRENSSRFEWESTGWKILCILSKNGSFLSISANWFDFTKVLDFSGEAKSRIYLIVKSIFIYLLPFGLWYWDRQTLKFHTYTHFSHLGINRDVIYSLLSLSLHFLYFCLSLSFPIQLLFFPSSFYY